MTPGELAVWRAVYAVAWFQPTGRATPGHVTDEERARFASGHATRAVTALRLFGEGDVSDGSIFDDADSAIAREALR